MQMEVTQDVGSIQPLGTGGWIGAYPPGGVRGNPYEGADSQGPSHPEDSTTTTTNTTLTFAPAPAPAPAPALCQNTHKIQKIRRNYVFLIFDVFWQRARAGAGAEAEARSRVVVVVVVVESSGWLSPWLSAPSCGDTSPGG